MLKNWRILLMIGNAITICGKMACHVMDRLLGDTLRFLKWMHTNVHDYPGQMLLGRRKEGCSHPTTSSGGTSRQAGWGGGTPGLSDSARITPPLIPTHIDVRVDQRTMSV